MAGSTDTKTNIALGCYYLAIILLVLFAGAIVFKLIFLPPCTQVGNACVVDGWSVAGLAAMVLGVAATVLAILGAVAVAAWWTSLNTRVNNRVKKLYSTQQKEVEARVDHLLAEQETATNERMDKLLAEQQRKADVQLAAFQTTLDSLSQDMSHVQELTERASELVNLTSERSGQQEALLQLANDRAKEALALTYQQLGESRRQAGALDGILKSFDELYQLWSKSSTAGERVKLIQQLLERDARLPSKPTDATADPKADNPADNSDGTTPTP